MRKLILTFLLSGIAALFIPAHSEIYKTLPADQSCKIAKLPDKVATDNLNPLKKVNVKRLPSPTVSTPIIETPDGTLIKNMRRDGFYTYPFYNMYLREDYQGMTCDMVETEDALYIQRPITYYGAMGWIKLDKDDDGIYRAHLPQAIDENQAFAVRLNINTLDFDKNADGEDVQDIEFTYKDGVLKQIDKDGVMAVMIVDRVMAYMEGNLTLSPVTEPMTEIPEAARQNITPYSLYYVNYNNEQLAQLVDICFDGNTVYMKNPISKLPDHWIKGQIYGNKIRFEKGQYFGPDPDNTCFHHYFTPASIKIFPAATVDNVIIYDVESTPVDALEFDWDENARTLTSADGEGFLLTTVPQGIRAMEIYYEPSMIFFDDGNSIPIDPIVGFSGSLIPYDEEYHCGAMSFRMSSYDTEGNYIDSSKLYYNVYIDDRNNPYIFTSSMYRNFTENTTDVPYELNDNYLFFADGDLRRVIIFIADYDFIGVQAVYKPERGEVRSNIVWYDMSIIDNVKVENSEIVDEKWYDLFGLQIDNPSDGIFVHRVIYSDGSVKNSKVIM